MNFKQAQELGLAELKKWSVRVQRNRINNKAENPSKNPESQSISIQLKNAPSAELNPVNSTFTCSANTMLELAAEVSACQRCSLCQVRKNTVTGRGAVTTGGILFVGEGPGEEEDNMGTPFVGRAGKLLDEMLNLPHKSIEADYYITNVIKCRPPSNRNPTQYEVNACKPYLMRQIDLLQPSLVVTLGKVAAESLLECRSSMMELRSKPHNFNGIPLLAHYHPAYLLRRPNEKNKAWQDLLKLQKHINSIPVKRV